MAGIIAPHETAIHTTQQYVPPETIAVLPFSENSGSTSPSDLGAGMLS